MNGGNYCTPAPATFKTNFSHLANSLFLPTGVGVALRRSDG